MNHRDTIGMLTAFAFVATIAVKPVAADNWLELSDDDTVSEANDADIGQDADNDVVIIGDGNTGTASSSHIATTPQANVNTDNDVQTGCDDNLNNMGSI